MFNLALILRETASARPSKPVLSFNGNPMSYSELDALSDRVAAGLLERGLAPGQPVGLQLPNIPQFLVAYFGVLKAGGVVVPMNVLLKAPEVAHQLRDSGARFLITWAGVADEAGQAAADAGIAELFVVGDAQRGTPFTQLLADVAGVAPFVGRDGNDPAVIIYTSGTTGRPKGAVLSHIQLFLSADVPGRIFGMTADDVVIATLPLFHVFALSAVLNTSVLAGATISLVPRFEPTVVLETIQRDRVTVFEGVPTMYGALLAHPAADTYDTSSLRVGISGGAAIPAELLDGFERRFGVTILEGYGLSETAAVATFNRSADERRAYSVGKPIWGTELQIWDGQRRALPAGSDQIGEIVTRGFHVMRGYHDNPEATAEAFTGDWFHTGDLGYVDEDGFVFIVDRKKELIIRGGYNVYPREIEEVLYAHPAVAEAAVIGIPDERLGEEVKAYVALRPGHALTTDELIRHCKDRVAAYKYPRSVEFLAELPKNATGKILKKDLPR